VLRGATEQLLDEAERSLHDALAVLSQTVKDPRGVQTGVVGEDGRQLLQSARERVDSKLLLAGRVLDLLTPGGGIADMRELGVVEAYKLKRAVVSSASERKSAYVPKLNIENKKQ
jgi:T-complex protein 1 subunit beta